MTESHLPCPGSAWNGGRWAHLGSNQGRIPPDRLLNGTYQAVAA